MKAADERIEVPGHDIAGLRAANPGPFTLTGTNSWLVGRDPTWLIDPGPALPEHLAAITGEVELRGGLGGIALTHDHPDHAEAVTPLRNRHPRTALAAARGDVDTPVSDGSMFGPLFALRTPGHSADHFAFVAGSAGFTGDAVLGAGSVFVAPYPGALRSYLESLGRLRALNLDVLCPGHGPLVRDPRLKLNEYRDHRLERERHLLSALEAGRRSVDELLDDVWSDAPQELRFAAMVTLAAHLDKLDEDGMLPAGVERPDLGAIDWV